MSKKASGAVAAVSSRRRFAKSVSLRRSKTDDSSYCGYCCPCSGIAHPAPLKDSTSNIAANSAATRTCENTFELWINTAHR